MSSKSNWIDFWDPYSEMIICLLLDPFGVPILPFDPGLQAYNNVNTSRTDQGLPLTDDVPPDDYSPEGDYSELV